MQENKFLLKGEEKREIVIFDLDDTLIKSTAKIKVMAYGTNEIVREMTAEEFNGYEDCAQYFLDFNEFEDPKILNESIFIHSIMETLRHTYEKGIPIAIVTARNSTHMVRQFFLDNGVDIHPELVVAVSDPVHCLEGTVAEKKLKTLRKFHEMGFTCFTFFDDNRENLRLSKLIENEKGVQINLIVVEKSVARKFIL